MPTTRARDSCSSYPSQIGHKYIKFPFEDRAAVYMEEQNLIKSLKGDNIGLYKQYKRSGKGVGPEDKKR